MERSTTLHLLAKLVAVGLVTPVAAATLYWDGLDSTPAADGGNGIWNVLANNNWDTATAAGSNSQWTAANVASFGGTAGTITVDAAGISAQRLIFTAGGYILSGGAIALSGGTNVAGGETFNVTSGITATVNDNITTSAGEVWLRGGGKLVLGGSNNIAGSLVISGGSTLEINAMAAIGGSSTNLYFNNSGGAGTFRYTGSSSALSRASAANTLAPSGVSTFDVANEATTLTIPTGFANNSAPGASSSFAKTGVGAIALTGNNTFTGGLFVREGTLRIGDPSGAIASQAVTLGNGTTSGKLTLGDASNSKSITVSNLATSGTGSANAVVGGNASNSTLTVNTTTFGNFIGSIGGTGPNENNINLIKSGVGTLTLVGNNTLTGKVLLNAGFLGIRYGTEFGTPTTPVADQLTINGGTLMNMTDAASATSFASGWSLTLGANVGITLGAAGGTIRVGYGSSKVFTIHGPISGEGALTKVDTGCLYLAGMNSYSGNTIVSDGLLQLTETGSLRFVVSNTGSNAISGAGRVIINGAFEIDTRAVTLNSGSWTLVNGTTLTESYGASFAVRDSGWHQDDALWYQRDGSRFWTYSKATGVLTLSAGGSFPFWICGYAFASLPGADISVTGDPDNDGIPNGIEHVFGTAPDASTALSGEISSNGEALVWTHPLNPEIASDLTYSYQWSSNLVDWQASGEANAAGTIAVITSDLPQNGRVAVTATISHGSANGIFVRLGVCNTQGLPVGYYFPKKQYVPEPLPTYAAAQGLLPEPVLPSHPEFQTMYWKCWQLAYSHLKQPQSGSPLVSNWLDEAFSASLFQWDTCFMMMFARYGHYQFPAIQSLDNFYALQRPSGYICREYREVDGQEMHFGFNGGYNDSTGWKNTINPPVFAWAETETFKVTGDKSRFAAVLPVLEHYVAWLNRDGSPTDTDMDDSGRRSAGTPHELYWNTGLGCGMDNTPKPTGAGAGWVDMSCQMVMQYNDLATIYRELGQTDKALRAEAEASAIATRINQWCWDEQDGFYYDVDGAGVKFKKKTVSGFWPLMAGVASPAQAARMVAHLTNPSEFWRPFIFPSLAANEPEYRADGGYWLGGVWAPTNYMIIKGLERYGYEALAAEASLKYIAAMAAVFQSTGTVWENYAPESMAKGNPSAGDFVGWTGCGPIALYIENVLGFRPDGVRNTLNWNLHLAETHGVKRLSFGSVIADILYDGAGAVTISSSAPFTLVINGTSFEIPQGDKQINGINPTRAASPSVR